MISSPVHMSSRLRLLCQAAGLLLLVALLAAGWTLAYRPLSQRVAAAQRRCEAAHELIDQGRAYVAERDRLRALVARQAAREKLLDQRLPATMAESQFLEQLTRLADRSQVLLRDYRPGAAVDAADHRHQQINVSVTGSYADLCRLLIGLRELPRLCNVTSLKVRTQNENVLHADFTLAIFSRR